MRQVGWKYSRGNISYQKLGGRELGGQLEGQKPGQKVTMSSQRRVGERSDVKLFLVSLKTKLFSFFFVCLCFLVCRSSSFQTWKFTECP